MADLLHFIIHGHWPKWTAWEIYRQARDYDFGTPLTYIMCECAKCGLRRSKCIHG